LTGTAVHTVIYSLVVIQK